jgi:small subunit ribosomal protein S1
VKGKIARFANFGAFVELDDNLEGLCHISELSEERVEKPEDVVKLGQEMEFKILRIDNESKKIGLSARAVGKDEPIVDAKVYSSQVGSGMASLGELAGLARPAEPESKSEPKSEAEAVREPKAQPEPQQEPGPAPEPVSEPEGAVAEAAAEPNTAPADEPEVQAAAEANTAPEAEAPETEAKAADEAE